MVELAVLMAYRCMAVYDVLPQAECRGVKRPVNRYDKRRFNAAYRTSIRRFNGVY